jgi:hypothetical protein
MPKFTKAEMLQIEATMRLRDLAVGHTLTKIDMEGIEYFLKHHIAVAKSIPLTAMTFEPVGPDGEFVMTKQEQVMS